MSLLFVSLCAQREFIIIIGRYYEELTKLLDYSVSAWLPLLVSIFAVLVLYHFVIPSTNTPQTFQTTTLANI